MGRAKKIGTIPGNYCDLVEYEYRGKSYYVEYSKSWQYCATPAHIQHRNAQVRIDAEIERENEPHSGKPVDLDEIWKLLGWDE